MPSHRPHSLAACSLFLLTILALLTNPASAKINTTTSLASSPNPSTYSQQVTLTVNVRAVSGSGVPTGTVTVKDGNTVLGSKQLVNGRATAQISTLAVGSHSLTAVYGGDSNYNGSTSPVDIQVVNKASTTTSLSSSINPSQYLQPVTFTATITPSSATGSVTFMDGSNPLLTVSVSNGTAGLTTSNLSVGSHSITAVYSGDSNYTGSTSLVLVQVVNAVLTSITVNPQGFAVSVGSTGQQYSAEGHYNDGSQQDITNSVTWASNATNVATINSGGVESPVAQGSTTISATSGVVQGTSTLTVYSANTFFVAVNGNDTWSGLLSAPNNGNTDGPFASPSRAQFAVEGASKPAAVLMRGGTYYLALTPSTSDSYPGTLVLNKTSDSGTSSSAQVTWQNYPNETPTISGGVPVTADPISGVGLHLSWQSDGGNLWHVNLNPSGYTVQPFEYLFYNGQRRLRSRIHDASSGSMGYYMSNGSCLASPNTPPNQPAPTLASCNLGTYLRVFDSVTSSTPPTNCPYAVNSNSTEYKCLDRFIYSDTSGGDAIASWANLHGTVVNGQPCTLGTNSYPAGDVEMTLVDAWTVDVMRVNCVDTSAKIIYLLGPTKGSGTSPTNGNNYDYFGPTKGHRFLIENTLDAFNTASNNGQVGLWFLDRSGSPWVLKYIADTIHGENPNNDNVIIPQLGGAIPGAPASDYVGGSLINASQLSFVTFQGIAFEMDNFYPDSIGFNNDVNGEMSLPQAIGCESCVNVTFDTLTVRHTSASGILIASPGATGPAATGDTVQYSVFYDIGDSGIRIGHTPGTKHGSLDVATNVVHGLQVHDNLVKGYSRVFADGEGITEGNGNSNSFIHNTVTDGYHAGLSMCELSCGPTDSSGNNVNGNSLTSSYNLLSNMMQGITSDGGALYYNIGSASSSGTGDVITSNVVYDATDSYIIDNAGLVGYKVNASAYGGEGIYLDAQSANVDVENNVVYNVDGNAIHLTEGVAWTAQNAGVNETPNTFNNNLFAFADLGMLSQGAPWVQGCPTSSVTEIHLTSNIFHFKKPNSNNSGFKVVQGCNNACGEPYNTYQDFRKNAYFNTISDFSLDTDAFRVSETQGPGGLDSQGRCINGTYFSLKFGNAACSWQTGTEGTSCVDSGGHSVPLPVTMDEDSSSEIFNSQFPATGQATDPPTDYSFSINHLTAPPNFNSSLTDDAITNAGRCTISQPPNGCLPDPAPAGVPGTMPAYNYANY